MTSIKSFVYEIVSILRLNEYFDDKKILNAYPFAVKPTQLSSPVIAVGIGDISLSSSQLGELEKAGSISLFIDIYIPFKMDSSLACDIFSQICSSLGEYRISSISTQRITADKTTSCYVMKSQFTFDREILFGGEQGE